MNVCALDYRDHAVDTFGVMVERLFNKTQTVELTDLSRWVFSPVSKGFRCVRGVGGRHVPSGSLIYLRMHLHPGNEVNVVVLGGVMHKIGIHGFAYMFINDTWIRSTKTPDEVVAAYGIKRRRR